MHKITILFSFLLDKSKKEVYQLNKVLNLSYEMLENKKRYFATFYQSIRKIDIDAVRNKKGITQFVDNPCYMIDFILLTSDEAE